MKEMSKTPEEIKIGLECCEKYLNGAPEEECCHVCNYANNCAELKLDALALIRQLEAERERDGENIKKLCSYLAYGIPDAHVEENNCKECKRKCECRDCQDGTCFIIRGKKEECKA